MINPKYAKAQHLLSPKPLQTVVASLDKVIMIGGGVGDGCRILCGAKKAEIVLEVIVARQASGRGATSSDAARLSVAVSHSLLGQPGRVLQSLLSRCIRASSLKIIHNR